MIGMTGWQNVFRASGPPRRKAGWTERRAGCRMRSVINRYRRQNLLHWELQTRAVMQMVVTALDAKDVVETIR